MRLTPCVIVLVLAVPALAVDEEDKLIVERNEKKLMNPKSLSDFERAANALKQPGPLKNGGLEVLKKAACEYADRHVKLAEKKELSNSHQQLLKLFMAIPGEEIDSKHAVLAAELILDTKAALEAERIAICRNLAKMGSNGKGAIPTLKKVSMDDPNDQVATEALKAIKSIESADKK